MMNDLRTEKSLGLHTTPIPGVLIIDLPVHADNRGWFKENWQRAKMLELGLPDFGPVQNNISFNDKAGTTRGIHAEPWDKFISVAAGTIFGAWVDLREGPGFGTVFTREIDPSMAIFVPAGVGNAYQTLEPKTIYTYLTNAHWSPRDTYTFLNLADTASAINWPIPLDQATLSENDRYHPHMDEVVPFPAATKNRRALVTGANGQLGRELGVQLPAAGYEFVGMDLPELDISDAVAMAEVDWSSYDLVINAAAWTDVNGAESPEGLPLSWRANAVGPANLAKAAVEHGFTLVHISSDYVFDGTKAPYSENDPPSPLGVYGQSKAAGDAAVTPVPRHYLVRTSWVIGGDKNFMRTMKAFADDGVNPTVVSDQIGRLTFAEDLASGIIHLVRSGAEFGTYNLSNTGDPITWYQVAASTFELCGHDPARVSAVTSAEYLADKRQAPRRPLNSTLDLSKIESTGFRAADLRQRMREYLAGL